MRAERAKKYLAESVPNILFGLQFALWSHAMAGDNIWNKVIIGFFMGWTLVTVIKSCLLEQDIRRLKHETMLTEIETEGLRHRQRIQEQLKEWQRVYDAGSGKSVSVQDLRASGFLFPDDKDRWPL
jgi:hypothetical protein